MNSVKIMAVAASLVIAMAIFSPIAKAGDEHWPTVVSYSEPFQIGNLVFPAGDYMIKRDPNTFASRVVMIYSLDRARWEGIVIAYPAHRNGTRKEAELTSEKQDQGKPQMLRYWFYRGWSDGVEFPSNAGTTIQVAGRSGSSLPVVASAAR